MHTETSATICVIGDSFACDAEPHGWPGHLCRHGTIENFSQRGISQFRLYTLILDNLEIISTCDHVVVFHTNRDRVYVPDHVDYPTRRAASHPHCDMVAADSLEGDWQDRARCYYRHFYDQRLQQTLHDLLVQRIQDLLPQARHFSGFDLQGIDSVHDIWKQHPGHVNHMNRQGNQLVYEKIQASLGLR